MKGPKNTPYETGDQAIPSAIAFFRNATNINFYAVRVYNRRLTDAEVLHNYGLDKARFGLSATDVDQMSPSGYLQSTGAQVFDTGIKMGKNSRIELDFQLTDYTAQDRMFGNDSLEKSFYSSLYLNSGSYFAMSCGDAFSGQPLGKSADKSRHTAIMDATLSSDQYKLITGTTTNTASSSQTKTKTPEANQTLFGRFLASGAVGYGAKMKLYGCKIYESGVLVRDYVPCVSNETVAGLWDRVSKTFSTGNSPRSFLYGGNVMHIGGKAPCIVSVGDPNQVINMRHRMSPKSRIEVDFAVNEQVGNARVFGGEGSGNATCLYISNSSDKFCYSASDTFSGVGSGVAGDYIRRTVIIDNQETNAYLLVGNYTNSTTVLSKPITTTGAVPIAIGGRLASAQAMVGSYEVPLRIYGVKIYEDGELVRDYEPYVKGGVAGLSDSVGGTFVTSEGAAFTTEGDVPTEVGDAYIESTGTGYIDSGYKVQPNTRIEFDGNFCEETDLSVRLFGTYNHVGINACAGITTEGQLFCICTNGVSGKWPSAGVVYTGINLSQLHPRRTYVLDVKNSQFSLVTGGYTNYTAQLPTLHDVTAAVNLLFFAANNNGTFEKPSKARLYGCRIYEDDVLVKSYRPEVVNAEPGLRELVGNTFIVPPRDAYNRYKVGGDITMDALSSDAYLEFDGAQAIDTGFLIAPTNRMEIDFSFTQLSSAAADGGQPFVAESKQGTAGLRMGYISSSTTTGGYLRYGYTDGSKYGDAVKPINFKRYQAIMNLAAVKTSNASVRYMTAGINVTKNTTLLNGLTIPDGTVTLKIGSGYGATWNFAKMRVYRFRLWANGESNLLHDLVPYKNGDVIGLYDLVGGEVFTNAAKTTQRPFKVGGRGFGSGHSDFALEPADSRVVSGETATLRAMAPGAVGYQWYDANGNAIEGATGDSLSVAWKRGGGTETYSVEAVFDVNGVAVRSEKVYASVEHVRKGFVIVFH